MTRTGFCFLFCLIVTAGAAHSQLSGYVSASGGHHANPLYNYEQLSDDTRQTYLELHYTGTFEPPRFDVSYVSGLMIFNRFSERNYYEHNLAATYSARWKHDRGMPSPSPQNEKEESDDSAVPDDSSGSYLDLTAKGGARHDKNAYKEFDNLGTTLTGSYRWSGGGPRYIRAMNSVGYRRYTNLPALSNVTEMLTLHIGQKTSRMFEFGVRTGAGLKYYTTSTYDTSLYEIQGGFQGNSQGKGKGGAVLKNASRKQVITSVDNSVTYQVIAAAYALTSWESGLLRSEFLYSYNPRSTSRYLTQYVNSSILTEDIYNDHFSSEGPALGITCKQSLPLDINATLTVGIQRKRYGAPAFDLEGNEITDNRIDLHSSADVYVSRYFGVFRDLGLDLALAGELLRNQSNDAYNDYSSFALSISLGISF